MRPFRSRLGAILAAVIYLVIGILVVEGVPAWEGPDEPAHFRYAAQLAYGTRPQAADTYESHQPPGYYLWPALAIRLADLGGLRLPPENALFPFAASVFVHRPSDPGNAGMRLLRTFSGLLGLVTICLTWAACRAAMPRRRPLPFLAAGLVATWPQFQFLAHVISNDVLAAGCGSLVVYGLVRSVVPRASRGPKAVWAVALGLGFGALVKLTVVGLAPAVMLVGLAILYRRWSHGARRSARYPSWPSYLAGTAVMALGVLVFAVAWNQALWLRSLAAEVVHRATYVDPALAQPRVFAANLLRTLVSLWARFGWQCVDPPPVVWVAGGALVVLALIGLLRAWPVFSPAERLALGACGALAISMLGAASKNLVVEAQPQGRFASPALTALAIGMAMGVRALIPSRFESRASILALGLLASLSVVTFSLWLPDKYAELAVPTEAFQRRQIQFPPRALLEVAPVRPSVRQTVELPRAGVARLFLAVAKTSRVGHLEACWSAEWAPEPLVCRRWPLARLRGHRWISLDVVAPHRCPDAALELRVTDGGWVWLWAMQPTTVAGRHELMQLVTDMAPPFRAAP